MKLSVGSQLFNAVLYSFLILLSVVTLYPLWHELALSLSSKTEALRGGFFFLPRDFTLSAYQNIMGAGYIWSAYKNTIFITVVGTVFSLLVTAGSSYALAKRTLPWKRLLLVLALFTMIFSGGLIPTYLVVKQLGLLNTLWAIILLNLTSAYNMIVMISFIRTIPEEMEESAMMDGANPLRTFFSIILPLCKPVLATLALWIGVGLWNNFFQSFVYLNDKSLYTLPLLLRHIIAGQQLQEEMGQMAESSTESVIAATIIVSIIPIIAVYPSLQRFFVKGALLGSVKS